MIISTSTTTPIKIWVECALRRVFRTFAHTFIGFIGANALIYEINWKLALGTSLSACLISVLNSIISLPEATLESTLIKKEELK